MIRRGWMWAGPLLALIWALGLWAMAQAEPGALYPVHWGADGRPDRLGGAAEAFLMTPLAATGLSLLLAFAPRLAQPLSQNLRRSAPVYVTVWAGTLLLLASLQAAIVLTAFGPGANSAELLPRVLASAMGLLLALIGNVLGKARRNWIMGVRTPWTLSSEAVWDRTHRLAAWVWTPGGLLLAGLAWVLPPPLLAAALVGFALGSSALFIGYSWWIWRALERA